jgi:hypothetical protein
MTGQLLGTMVGLDLIVFASQAAELGYEGLTGEDINLPFDEAINSARAYVKQLGVGAFDKIGLDGRAFGTGVDIGTVGMSIAETITTISAPRNKVLDDPIRFTRPSIEHDIRFSVDWEDLRVPNSGIPTPVTAGGPPIGGGASSIPIPIPRVRGGIRVGTVTQTIPISRRALMSAAGLALMSTGSGGEPPQHPNNEDNPYNSSGGQMKVTRENLDIIRRHLDRMGHSASNDRMLERLEEALQQGRDISDGDLNFYLHELAESEIMDNLISQNPTLSSLLDEYPLETLARYEYEMKIIRDLPPSTRLSVLQQVDRDIYNLITWAYSHQKALDRYNASPFSLYPPEIYRDFPQEWGPDYQDYWPQ